MNNFEALLNTHLYKQNQSKKRRERRGVHCNKMCSNRLLCPDSHGDDPNDLDFCLCQAWWCGKSHPDRRYNDDDSKSTPPHGYAPPPGYVCKRCKSTTHYVNDCPQNVCSYCQDIGHTALQCPRNIERWQTHERIVKSKR